MTIDRGHPGTDEPEAQPLPDAPAATSDDTDDESTTVWWWVRTIASWTLLAAAVGLLAVLVVIPRLTGSTAYTVLTGSMEPNYPPGTLIVAKPTPGDQLNAGDVITFQPKSGDPAVVTHRITSIIYDAQGQRRFITKGDANNAQDPTQLVADQIRGRLLYSVPYIGRLNVLFSGSTRGVAVFVIGGGLALYALWMWISGLRDKVRKKHDTPAVSGNTETGDILQAAAAPVAYSAAPAQSYPAAPSTPLPAVPPPGVSPQGVSPQAYQAPAQAFPSYQSVPVPHAAVPTAAFPNAAVPNFAVPNLTVPTAAFPTVSTPVGADHPGRCGACGGPVPPQPVSPQHAVAPQAVPAQPVPAQSVPQPAGRHAGPPRFTPTAHAGAPPGPAWRTDSATTQPIPVID